MFKKITIEGRYQYLGDSYGFYKRGETYHLTVVVKHFWRWGRIEVSCRHGYSGNLYPYSNIIIYKNEDAFEKDWQCLWSD